MWLIFEAYWNAIQAMADPLRHLIYFPLQIPWTATSRTRPDVPRGKPFQGRLGGRFLFDPDHFILLGMRRRSSRLSSEERTDRLIWHFRRLGRTVREISQLQLPVKDVRSPT
jgi:hypothetical protein